MRALSHYWRVTRQDNVVAQALLEKAIAIDPNYGQALGVLATSHPFSAHMGWSEMAPRMTDRRTRRARGDPGRQRGPVGAQRARSRSSVRATLRRFARRIRDGAAAQSEFFAGARLTMASRCPIAVAGQEADEAARRALRLSPRDPFSAIYYGIAAYAQFVGRNYDEAMRLCARSHSPARRFRRSTPRADGRRWHGGAARCRGGRTAGTATLAAQHFPRLDSAAICRSGMIPTENIISKASAAPDFGRARSGLHQVEGMKGIDLPLRKLCARYRSPRIATRRRIRSRSSRRCSTCWSIWCRTATAS